MLSMLSTTTRWPFLVTASRTPVVVRAGRRYNRLVGRRYCVFFFSSRRRHTRLQGDWSSDVCSSDLRRMKRCEIASGAGDFASFHTASTSERNMWAQFQTSSGFGTDLEAGKALVDY